MPYSLESQDQTRLSSQRQDIWMRKVTTPLRLNILHVLLSNYQDSPKILGPAFPPQFPIFGRLIDVCCCWHQISNLLLITCPCNTWAPVSHDQWPFFEFVLWADKASRKLSVWAFLSFENQKLGTSKGLFINYVILFWAFSDPHPLPVI